MSRGEQLSDEWMLGWGGMRGEDTTVNNVTSIYLYAHHKYKKKKEEKKHGKHMDMG